MPSNLKSLAALLALSHSFVLAAPRPDLSVERAPSRTQTAVVSVSYTPAYGEWVGEIIVKQEPYKVVFDTGSNALWVQNNSTSGGRDWHQGYGSGNAAGTVDTSDVTVGDISFSKQDYGLAPTSQLGGSDRNFEGLIGLGTGDTQLNNYGPTWLANVVPLLKEPIFVVDLDADTKRGTFTFGYDPQSSSGSPSASDSSPLPVYTDNKTWDISVRLDGLDEDIKCDLDTGTTDVVLPQAVYDAYHRENVGKCPYNDLVVTSADGQKFSMPGANVDCGGKVQPDTKNSCILGQPFIAAFSVLYNYDNKSVSLRKKN